MDANSIQDFHERLGHASLGKLKYIQGIHANDTTDF